MYNDEDLRSAVAAGVLTEESVAALRAHVAARRQAPLADGESFRLVSGFNDFFVVIACALLLVALGWLSSRQAAWLGGIAVAATAWGLAEFFVRRRRMAFPAIVLSLAAVGGTVAAGVLAFSSAKGWVGAGIAGAVGAWLHWRRFRVPITVAAGAASLIGALGVGIVAHEPRAIAGFGTLSFTVGLLVFGLALRWDISDPARRTERADVAFWLHVLAAPLIVHPVFGGLDVWVPSRAPAQTAAVMALYLLIALVSLCIDRRALMVSALTFVLVVVGGVLGRDGLGPGLAWSALCIGTGLLLLSAFWHNARARLMRWVPAPVRQRLPPLQ